MYKMDEENLRALVEVNSLLDQLGVTGIKNAHILVQVAGTIQAIIQNVSENKDEGVVISNGKPKEDS